VNVLYSSSS